MRHPVYRPVRAPIGAFCVFATTAERMTFRLHQAQYDDQTERAYVEFRRGDGDGGEQVVVAVFTYRTKERLTKQRMKEEVVRKARHVLKGAALAA
jgi:hypothetical protein